MVDFWARVNPSPKLNHSHDSQTLFSKSKDKHIFLLLSNTLIQTYNQISNHKQKSQVKTKI